MNGGCWVNNCIDKKFIVSFCHGYQNDDIEIKRDKVPALLLVSGKNRSIASVKSLFFPKVHDDFFKPIISKNLMGEMPLKSSPVSFLRLPRFGVMGIVVQNDLVYCATWNGIYILNRSDLSEKAFLSHRLICDPHGIAIQGDSLFTVLTSLDLVVITNLKTGEIEDYFSIDRNLRIVRDKKVVDFDWRFISKQYRGAVGNWHFNHIRLEGDKIFLTSRLASCLAEIDLKKESCRLRTVCWDTPVMIHDGIQANTGEIVFTSVDGKILICDKPEKLQSPLKDFHHKEFHPLMKRDYVNSSIRLQKILGREVNWCRGIYDNDTEFITTIDGRYDQEMPFFSVCFVSKEDNSQINFCNVGYELLDFPDKIRYMTGFDIEKI
jgi:hypothetical protein